jgi:hypothetical protein
MKMSERTLRISAASVLALFMVGTAYALSGPNFLTSRIAGAGTTEELLKAYAEKDTDTDGLPDWQEALYGTDPNKADTDGDGVTDGEAAAQGKLTPSSLAVQLPGEETGTSSPEQILSEIPGVDPAPGSITEQFSRDFLQRIVDESRGAPLTEEQKQQLATQLFAEYSAKAATLFVSKYSAVSVRTDLSVSISSYAGSVEEIMYAHDVPAEANQPLPLMEALIKNDDESARPKLEQLAESYAAITADLVALRVPPALSEQHIALVRGFDSLAKATEVVTEFERDPLAVMGALSQFQPASLQITQAFKNLAVRILSTGEPIEGQPGAVIVNIARSAETP